MFGIFKSVAWVALGLLFWLTGHAAQAVEISNAPVTGPLSSPFGWRTDPMTGGTRFHAGVDIAAPAGSPVYLPQDGVVVYSGAYGGYGNVVVVQHGNGIFTLYGHNAYVLVRYGERVRQGQVIAAVGSTGRSTGPHLHFEVHQHNRYVNPVDYLLALQSGVSGGVFLAQAAPPPDTRRAVATTSPRPAPRRHKAKPTWRVELIKGSDVERVDF